MEQLRSTLSKCIIVGIICSLITFLVTTQFNNYYNNLNYINFKNSQDSLSLIVDSLRKNKDSIITKIECRYDTIEKVNTIYETKVNNMLHMPVDEQFEFFSEYVRIQDERFSNSNNSETITDN